MLMNRGAEGAADNGGVDLVGLDAKVRVWLRRVPIQAIIVVLEAIHDELVFRTRTQTSRSAPRSLAPHRSS